MSMSPNTFTLPGLTSSRALPDSSFVPTVTDMRNDYPAGTVENALTAGASQASPPSHIPTTSLRSSNAGTQIPSGGEFRSNERPFLLAKIIEPINETRQVMGMKEFSAHRRLSGTLSLSPWTVTEQNGMQAASQCVQQLRRNLEQAFQLWNISTSAHTAYGNRLLDERTIRCVALVPVILLGSFKTRSQRHDP